METRNDNKVVVLFRRSSNGDNGTPQKASSLETAFPFANFASARRVVNVWQAEVKPSLTGSTLGMIVRYPSGIERDSAELPGFGCDKLAIACEVGGTSAQVVRCLRGETHMGIEIQLPEKVRTSLSGPRGLNVSLVWSGAQWECKNSIVFRLRAKKV